MVKFFSPLDTHTFIQFDSSAIQSILMVDLNSPPPMYASALVIDPADPSTIAQLSHSTLSESQMSALVGSRPGEDLALDFDPATNTRVNRNSRFAY
jgi:hypothetical protein